MISINKKILFLLIFIFLSIVYFWYFFNIYLPKKSVGTSNFFTKNESSRHILKVGIMSEKSYRHYVEAINKNDEDLFYDALDFALAAEGFSSSPSFPNIKASREVRLLIRENINIMEKHELAIDKNSLNIIFKNLEKLNISIQNIEMLKYNSFLEDIVKREEKSFTIIILMIYLSISIFILIVLLLYFLRRNKKLEENNLKQQRVLLTQSKVEALADIIINIAHQWRQPLSAITTSITSLNLYAELGQKVTNKQIKECSNDIMEQSTYLSNTIEDLREFVSEDTISISNKNLYSIFSKINTLIKDSYLKESINVHLDIDHKLMVNLNENLLIQSLLNIYYNAEEAFITNNIQTEDRYLFINAYKKHDELSISIKDSAGGIDEKIIDKIFDPYFTTKHKSFGTGIGLFRTSQIIVNYFKGSIEVNHSSYTYMNKEFKGAEFRIVLRSI